MSFKDSKFSGYDSYEKHRKNENIEGLPVERYREKILEMVENNQVVIITAETGAGKSTKVPQFLLDAGYRVVVTQPRRLAARSVAARVAEERKQDLGGEVGFRTAYEKNDGPDTKLLFCTDGLQLVRELSGSGVNSDSKTILVLDEVHEWNMNMETLVAWAKKQMMENKNFKVVLMSATLDAANLANFFGVSGVPAPKLEIPGSIFPVEEVQSSSEYLIDNIISLVREGRNVLVFQPGKKEINDTIKSLREAEVGAMILPLHGELEPSEQQKVFKHYPLPKVVVATNVAQTSITIDDIDAVVDSGVERQIQVKDGVEGLYLADISKADCLQRKGRAGRCRPGVYYLCSKLSIEQRDQYPQPEIHRSRLDQMVLRLAANGLDATDLEFFHQPDRSALLEAKRALIALGAMTADGKITAIGQKISRLPVDVHIGRMVIEAQKNDCLDDILTIAACMEVGGLRDRTGAWRSSKLTDETQSDVLADLDIYRKALNMNPEEMRKSGIFVKAFFQIKELRKHLVDSLKKSGIRWESVVKKEVSREAILKSVASGMVDHLYQHHYDNYYRNGEDRVISRDSVVTNYPKWVVALPMDIQFKDKRGNKKILKILNNVSSINPEWFLEIAPQLVEKKHRNLSWDIKAQSIVVDEYILFNGIEIKSDQIPAERHENNNEVLFDALLNGYLTDSETAMRIYQYNKDFLSFFESLWYRSGGKINKPLREHVFNLYKQKLSQYMIKSTAEFDSVVPSCVSEKDLCLQREDFLSEEEITRIEKENPLSISLQGKTCSVSYGKSYYGDFYVKVDLTNVDVSDLEDDCLDTLLPQDRKLEISFTYQSGSYTYSQTVNSVKEAKEFLKSKRSDNLRKEFVSKYEKEVKEEDVEDLLKNFPKPQVYDEINGLKLYPALRAEQRWGNIEYRLVWLDDESDALDMTKKSKHFFYRERVSEWYSELGKISDDLYEKFKESVLDGESLVSLKQELDDLKSKIYNFRSNGDLDEYEELKSSLSKFEQELSLAVEKTQELIGRNEIFVNFRVWHRTGGKTNLGDGWVIMPDGQLRDPDEKDIPRHKADGYYIWRTVGRNELALQWEKHDSSHPGDFNVVKKPFDGLTPEQLERVKEIEKMLEWEGFGSFGLDEQLERNKEALVNEIRKTVKRVKNQSLDLSSIKLSFLELSSENGIILNDKLNAYRLLVSNKPFDYYCDGRPAQLVYSQRLSRGVLEFLVYDKYGQYNVAMRLKISPEELAAGDAQEFASVSETPVRAGNRPISLADVAKTVEESGAESDNPFAGQFQKLLKKEKEKPMVPELRESSRLPELKTPSPEPKVNKEEIIFRKLEEMTSDEMFAEYEENELIINGLKTKNPDMEVIFKEYADCLAEGERVRADIKETLKKRDLASDEKRRQMAIVQLKILREKEDELKRLEKILKEKVKAMQADYDKYQLYRQRQEQIEALL